MKKAGFSVLGLDTGKNDVCYTYVRYFDAIGYMVIADSVTDKIYAVRFSGEDELQAFKSGEFAVNFEGIEQKTACGYPSRPKKKIDLLEKINVVRVTRKIHVLEALRFFETYFVEKEL